MKWNRKRIEELLPQVAKEIQLIQPGHAHAEDIFVWHPLQSGTYTTRSGYYAAATETLAPINQNLESFQWNKDVWATKCSPKIKLFLWSVVQEALPLGELLQKRGINSEALCVRCKAKETAMHTFFLCPFAQEVWNLIPLKQVVHLATDCSFKQALVEFRKAICLPPTGIPTDILPWVCWALWSARNIYIFENRILTSVETTTKAISLAREWNSAQHQAKLSNQTLPRERRAQTTNNEEGYMICKSDAAYDKKTKLAGVAWIFSDTIGNCINQGTTTFNSISSPLIAEAIALRAGVLSAVNLEYPKLKAFSDNLTLIRAINNDMQVKEIFGIVKDIQQISSVFVEKSFSHVSRALNGEADRLAKLSLSNSFVSDPLVG